jgi:DNA-binding SARP family transcriptional activator
MDFRILGPLEITHEGTTIPLGGRKQQALLALLLLHPNETLGADRLIDELWGERPPAGAAKTLQMQVSRLRRALADAGGDGTSGLVATRGSGYELAVDPERLDSHRFEALTREARQQLAAGRPARALELLERALSLWRGPALGELAYEPFVQNEIARLNELRAGAQEELIEAKLALGRHADVIGPLAALIDEHPFRERLRGQLMLALYRSDRQADALQAYQDARMVLVEELGIEPGARLRELERAVLAQDPGLHLPAAEDAPSHGSFVGRDAELSKLVAGLEDVLAGRGRLFLLAGEPGIGKSRLAEEITGRARSRGADVLVGRCWEAGGAPAYWPWVQALRGYLGLADPDALRRHLGAVGADLAQLLPELRELYPELPEPQPLDAEGARFRLFEAVGSFLRSAARDRPLVLVLDDLHAADQPSLLMLQFLARESAGSPLMVLAAYRDVDPTLQEPLDAALAELVREPHTTQISLGGLSEPEVAEFFERSTGVEPAGRLVGALHAETEGNPLFVAEVVRLLESEGRLSEADAHLGIPAGARAVIRRRLGRLSEECQRLLVPASVMGREFDLEVLAHAATSSASDVLAVLDEAMAERVVGEVPGSSGRLRFEHALIGDALYDELPPGRRSRLHLEAGEATEAVHARDLPAHYAELARHFSAALPAGDAAKASDYTRRAAGRASDQLAYEEAARLYGTALTLTTDDRTRCELLLALGDAQARGGDTPGSQESFLEAADVAERLGLSEHLARAALEYGGRFIWEVSRGDEDRVPLIERALAALGEEDSELRVKLLTRLAGGPLRDSSHPRERRRHMSGQALEMAERLGDPGTTAYALSGYIAAHQSPGDTRAQDARTAELMRAATEAGDLERLAEAHEHHCVAMIELGEMERARADLGAMARLADELRQPSQTWFVSVYQTLLLLLEGRFAEAEESMSQTRRSGERALGWNAEVTYRLQLFLLRREQGRLAEIEDLVRASVEEYPTYPIWRCVLTQTAAELGHTAEARERLDSLAAERFGSLPFDEGWLVSLSLLSETAATLERAEHAAVLYELLMPYADRIAIAYPEIAIGSVSRYLGLLAATLERPDDAERHFRDAISINERIGALPALAHTQRDYAEMQRG